MERRFLLFLLLSFAVLLANAWWNMRNAPQRVAQQDAQLKGDQQQNQDPAVNDSAAEGDAGDQPSGAVEAQSQVEAGGVEPDSQPNKETESEAPLEFVTLGSVDEASDFLIAATITSAGAGVRRLEFASPRYLDLEDKRGYLGHLELASDAEEGLLVRAVCEGTPAALAGLMKGDRILQIGATELVDVPDVNSFDSVLQELKPGDELQLKVARDGGVIPSLVAKLVRTPLSVIRPESENQQLRTDVMPEGFAEPPSFRMTLGHLDGREISADSTELQDVELLEANWRIVQQDESSVTFERRIPNHSLVVRKTYELASVANADETAADDPTSGYHLKLGISILNKGQEPNKVAYLLEGPNGLPVEGWWYANKIGRNWGAAGLRDITGRYFGGTPEQQAPVDIVEEDAEEFQGGSMAYMAVDAQYFGVALLPNKTTAEEQWIDSVDSLLVGSKPRKGEERFANVTYRLLSNIESLQPGQKLDHSYTLFAGPKRPELLSEYKAADAPRYTLVDLVYYGWFSSIARAMLGILHFFYGIVGNYGIAIILLTALVRGCMFPISRSQAHSMVRMQELRPEMERIKEKYKGDQQKQAQAMQELYRKHKVNPLAGCLPMLIQLPVFVGLYRGLAVDVELRQASLFGDSIRWCSNLAAPDMFLDWSGFMPDFVNRGDSIFSPGPYLNVLPLITVTLWILQQKLFMPPPANEQAELQQKIMKYMMLFMGVLFYKVPSGLCLYFISSTLWGIAERKLAPPPTAKTPESQQQSETSGSRSKAEAKSRRRTETKRASTNGRAGGKQRSKSKRRR